MSENQNLVVSQQTGSLNLNSKNPFRDRIAAQLTGSTNVGESSVHQDSALNNAAPPNEAVVQPARDAALEQNTQPGPRHDGPHNSQSQSASKSINSTSELPALPQRKPTGALNSSSVASSPSPSAVIGIPPESLSRIFQPPSGPPPVQSYGSPSVAPPAPAANSQVFPPIPRSITPPPLPPRRPTVRQRSNSSGTMRILTEELPPAYTPGPDTIHGEQTVEFGPVRPFTNQMPAVRQPLRPQRTSASQSAFGPSGGGRRDEYVSLTDLLADLFAGSSGRSRGYGPQTRAPTSVGWNASRPTMARGTSSRTAQFLSPQVTGPVVPGLSRHVTGSPLPQSTGRWNQYPGQRSAVPSPAPIPVPQPTQSVAGASNAPPRSAAILAAESDGKPTVRPTPGHPLLKDGRVLVYPLGFECRKCHNKGYRPFRSLSATSAALAPGDPSHPCSRCWDKYVTPYEGALKEADWLGNRDGTSTGINYQRPIAELNSGYNYTTPSTQTSPAPRLGGSGFIGVPPGAARVADRAPRGSTVVRPGDPRIGGRLCWRCGGRGWITVFIFDSERCRVCGGTGRIM